VSSRRPVDLERDRPHDDLAGFDLGEVEQIVHQVGERIGGLADERHLTLLF
jgi:hypothetical protein